MRAIVTDRIARSVSLSVTYTSSLSPAKRAEQIDMPFGLRAGMGPTLSIDAFYSRMDAEHMKCNRLRTHHWCSQSRKESCEMGGPDPSTGRGNFGERGSHCKIYGLSAVSCAKTAEPIDLSFGLWTRVGPRKHKFSYSPSGANVPSQLLRLNFMTSVGRRSTRVWSRRNRCRKT